MIQTRPSQFHRCLLFILHLHHLLLFCGFLSSLNSKWIFRVVHFFSFTSQPCFLCSDLCQTNHFLLWYLSFWKPRRNVFSLAINCFRRFLRTPSVTNARFLIFHSFRCFTLSIATRLSSFPFSISVVPFGLWALNSLPFRFALTLLLSLEFVFSLVVPLYVHLL